MTRRWRLFRAITAILVVVATFWFVLPLAAGAPWSHVAAAVRAVPFIDLAMLCVLWFAGLGLHTVTLTAALPQLTHRRAMTLSLTGSAIANVLPLGGAAGVAMNYKMARSWGFSGPAIATYTVITNVWDVLVKLCVPAVALSWVLVSGTTVSRSFLAATVGATALLLVLSVGICAVLGSPRVARGVGAGLDRVAHGARRVVGSSHVWHPGLSVVRLQADCAWVIGRGWPRLTTGVVAYNASLCLLLWGCLHVTGAALAVPAVVAGFAFERLLTLAGLTPGGAGLVEAGLSGLLLLLGGAPLGVVAGVLLYRLFTFGLEIPVGGLGLAGWLWSQRRPSGGAAVG
ncbi:lysylphosphatidylglycerol synthase domain-containing protein [Nocardioides sp.]|uniref:lysylphosphatidylglycerol synthase domain-containing protein n=1 Tax=Nocardioides sp. TaxID=35761 RepID=UPI00286E9BB0|nr:lysylphosphatidylglycerol synthase domain-containing protein [Nocardioides sp.]